MKARVCFAIICACLCVVLLAASGRQPTAASSQRVAVPTQPDAGKPHPCPTPSGDEPSVSAPPNSLNLAPFYRKYLAVRKIPIVASDRVCNRALQVAYGIIKEELSGPAGVKIAERLVEAHARIAIFSDVSGENYTDLPEMAKYASDPEFPPWRCGGGGVKPDAITAVCEGNLLGGWWASLGPSYEKLDEYRGRESVLIHEFGHTIHNLGLSRAERAQVEAAYRDARNRKLFPNAQGTPSYMMNNSMEFFAESTQIWFHAVDPRNPANAPGIWERGQLQAQCPQMYRILAALYPDDKWSWPNR